MQSDADTVPDEGSFKSEDASYSSEFSPESMTTSNSLTKHDPGSRDTVPAARSREANDLVLV